jgi:hypothetical protein
MIDKTSQEFSYNTYRPDLFNEIEFTFWNEIHSYIKECEYPITVNNAFYFIEDMLAQKSCYGGGGFHYIFWFNTETDKNAFEQMYLNKLKEFRNKL